MRRTLATIVIATLLMAGGVQQATPSLADNREDTISALLELNPGLSSQELLNQAEELAKSHNSTTAKILDQQLTEARQSVASVNAAKAETRAKVKLVNASRRGDLFISPSSTAGIPHGHTGIYAFTDTIVEAPGPGKNSRRARANALVVEQGTILQYVTTSQTNRTRAANYANEHMVGKPYNLNFVSNKKVPATHYNCSQLVWGAYKITSSIDLDGNGGWGVYPNDIKISSKTVTYRTL